MLPLSKSYQWAQGKEALERAVSKWPFALGSESGFQNPADSLPASFSPFQL